MTCLLQMSQKKQHTHFEDKILRTLAGEDKLCHPAGYCQAGLFSCGNLVKFDAKFDR